MAEPVASAADAVNSFGVALLQQLSGGGNVVISPLSVAVALSMVANGADGQALAELDAALHSGGEEERRNAELSALLHDLATTADADLRIAQSLWVQQEFPFRPDYIERVRETFTATLDEVDFTSPSTGQRIDTWVSEHTQGLIKNMADDLDLPDPSIVLVVLNATYFHGRWDTPFDPHLTRERAFHLANSNSVQIPFMTMREGFFGYREAATHQLLRMPYGEGGRVVMDVYLPAEGRPVAEVYGAMLDNVEPPRIETERVAVPKLRLERQMPLRTALEGLGVQAAWDPDTRPLPRMSPETLYLSNAVHKTYIEVDEAGTKAAGVTGLVARPVCARLESGPTFIADRPFAFAIRDTETGVLLFAGVVNDPTA